MIVAVEYVWDVLRHIIVLVLLRVNFLKFVQLIIIVQSIQVNQFHVALVTISISFTFISLCHSLLMM
jgi:hypothetical protein